MLRKLTVVLGLTMSLLVTHKHRPSQWTSTGTSGRGPDRGDIIAGPLTDPFVVAKPNTPPMGEAVNTVYFDGSLNMYVHEVIPSLNDNFALTTGFDVAGYTGTAGWSFLDAGAAGGSGTAMDFLFFDPGQLQFVSLIGIFDGTFPGWDAGESIKFFFVSTRPPALGFYNLIGRESGTAVSFAPIPEPGSIALLGSGLVGLYAAMRRRRSLRA